MANIVLKFSHFRNYGSDVNLNIGVILPDVKSPFGAIFLALSLVLAEF